MRIYSSWVRQTILPWHRILTLQSSIDLLLFTDSFAAATVKQCLHIPSLVFIITMCIQWCCKSCFDKLTKLTHLWARERCNDYFIARSQNENTTACPKGPWELRRAFHRYPYRGSQRCNECIRTGWKEKKLVKSTRQKANEALGQQPEYTESISLGELEVPETFGNNTQRLLEPGKVDAMKAKWESFSAANGHLPSDELEHEWATGFAGFNGVDLMAGVWPQTSGLSSTVGQRMSEEVDNQFNATLAGELSQNPHQQTYRHAASSTHERKETPYDSAHIFIQYDPNATIRRRNRTQGSSTVADSHVQCNIPETDTNRRNLTSAKETASHSYHHHHQLPYNIRPGTIDNRKHSTVIENKPSLHPDLGQIHCNPSSTMSPSSSQPTRTRPWDL